MSIEDLFRTKFTDPAPMSFYDPLFGEEEMVALQAARPRLEGRTDVPIGATGFTGAGIVAAGQREASRAAALGDMVAQARGQRIKAREAANLKRIQERAAAESAARQQQSRLASNIMAGVGQLGGNVEDLLSNKMFQAHFKGLEEKREARKLDTDLRRAEIANTQDFAADWASRNRGLNLVGDAPTDFESMLRDSVLASTPFQNSQFI